MIKVQKSGPDGGNSW